MDIVDAIQTFNAGREPERLAMKYENLRKSPFVFLRGTCHLFYQRLPKERVLSKAPVAWICGDLHFENFGSYKGGDRLVYFDINDFDESVLAPVTWELVRSLASILVAADTLHAKPKEAHGLCETFLEAYARALTAGKAGWVDRDNAEGQVEALLEALKQRKREKFLDSRTQRKGRRRVIECDGKHALEATGDQKRFVMDLVESVATREENPGFFEVLDVARRIAGTGSLGVERYVVLVKGKGSPDGNYLLDLKQAPRSSLEARVKVKQPKWESQAHRIVALQQRLQAMSPAFLRPVSTGATSYVLRELQASEDRVDLDAPGLSLKKIGNVLRQMGEVSAWDQLRSSGRQRSAIADELIDFGASHRKWRGDLLAVAERCAKGVSKDWAAYCDAYDKGVFKR